MKRDWPDSSGWSDYLMVRWFVTGNAELVLDLHRRAVERHEVGSKGQLAAFFCRWMLSEVREVHSDFDAELAAVELVTGCPVERPRPRELRA